MLTFVLTDGHNDVEYKGFNHAYNPTNPPEGATHLAVVMNEGAPDLWWLSPDKASGLGSAIKELRRYYEEQEPWVLNGSMGWPNCVRLFVPVLV